MDPAILARALELSAAGMPCLAIAKLLKVPNPTLARWLKRAAHHGGDAEAACEPVKTGRPPVFAPNEYELARARWFRCAKESLPVAAYFFARDEHVQPNGDRVREETRAALLAIEERALASGAREAWPESVRRAFRVTPQERADFRGRKAAMSTEMVTRRGMYEIMADGTTRDILPGEVWEMDDYSANQPYIWKDPASGELLLGRQVLGARDLSSARWLGFDHIGRERDAYRGEDIVRYIARLVAAWGLPGRLRLERGSWESDYIHGIEVPGMTGRWGALDDLFEIDHVFKSKGKGLIEGGFNMLQRFLSQTGTDIGRTRGEFEEATRRLRQVRDNNGDPMALGFLTQEQSGLAHFEAAKAINSRPMHRAHLEERVSADDLVARHGWHTRPLPPSMEWYFLPYKVLRTVRGGTVETTPGNGWKKHTFQLNGVRENIYLENGHQVLVAYDPARPDRGAYIANADRSARNRSGWGMGQPLLDGVPDCGLAPQFNASGILDPRLVVRKKAAAAAATSFRAIQSAAGLPAAAATREAAAMDGKGRSATAGDIRRQAAPSVSSVASVPPAAPPAAIEGPVPEWARNPRQTSLPPASAIVSRAMPATVDGRAAEIARLAAALEAD